MWKKSCIFVRDLQRYTLYRVLFFNIFLSYKLMNRTILLIAAVLLTACASKPAQTSDNTETTDEETVELQSDSLIAVQAIEALVTDVYIYLDSYQDGMPSLDEKFGSKEWQNTMAELRKMDEGKDDPLFSAGYNPWTFDLYEGRITPDTIAVNVKGNGKADVNFLLKDAMSIKGLPVQWVVVKEDGEWKVQTIIDQSDDYLLMMKVYMDDEKFNDGFDVRQYLSEANAKASEIFSNPDVMVDLNEYALLDIDRDGKAELCLRQEEQGYDIVFSIATGKPELLASADGRTSIVFFDRGVGSQGSCGTGCHMSEYSIMKDSRAASLLQVHEQYDMVGELEESQYVKDHKQISSDEASRTIESLGETVDLKPIWHAIEPGEVVESKGQTTRGWCTR